MSCSAWRNLNPFDLHKTLINEYFLTTRNSLSSHKRDTSTDKTDFDVIRENHKFLWDEKDEENADTWEKRLAKKYYDKLYKEYCIADLSRYKENKFGLRWRTEEELISGRGQFSCGNKKCKNNEELKSWEVNFAYKEDGEKKNALVKLRLCSRCSIKLNYRHKRKEVKRLKRRQITTENVSSHKKSVHENDSVSTNDSLNESNGSASEENNEMNIWKHDKPTEEKSREEEFEEYLEKLFF